MKNILNVKNGILNVGIVLVCTISLVVFTQGCSNENDVLVEKVTKYLDIDVYNYTRSFTDNEILVLNEAFLRIEDYISFDGEKITVTVNYGDVNISERLYGYLLLCDITTESKGLVRLKGGGVEITYGQNYTREELNLNHSEIMTLMNGMQSNYSHVGFGTAVTGWFPGAAFCSFVIGAKSYLEGQTWSNLENNYLESGSTSGARLVKLTTYSPTTGMSFTSYRLAF